MSGPSRRVLVVGAGGMLGAALLRRLSAASDAPVIGLTHGDLDITDEGFVRARLAELGPDVVVNCAAFTRVDACEEQAEHAMQVNGAGAGILARAARDCGARVVHVSTDYVFTGEKPDAYDEQDAPGPDDSLNAYGRSKLEGERQVQSSGARWLIVRTSWLFGHGGPNFVQSILDLARSRPELRVVNDQRGRPTYAPDLAEAIASLLDRGAEGLVHAANLGACSWYEFAREIVARAALDVPVRPCTTAEFPRQARRPANSVLDTGKYERLVGRGLRHWGEALTEYLKGSP